MKLTSLALSAALALTATASFAQPPPPPPGPGPASHEGHQWRRPDPAQMAQFHAQMMQRRAQHLRDALQLRPDQEGALQALLAAEQPPAGEHEHMRRGEDAAPLTTPQRLDRMQAKMAEHDARFRARAEAIKRFYAQLSPPQQRAFDALHPMGMGHGRHGHHGMGGPGKMGRFHGGPDHRPPPPPAG